MKKLYPVGDQVPPCRTPRVSLKDDTRKVHRPSDRDVNWMSPVQGESPLVQVKEPYGNFDMVTIVIARKHFINY